MGCLQFLRVVEEAFVEPVGIPKASEHGGNCCCQCPLSHRRNLVEEVNATYMKTCLYHKISHPLCPVFNLGYVAQQSGQNFSTLAEKVLCQASEEG